MEAPVSASEAQADSTASTWGKGHQAVPPDQVQVLPALASSLEADLHLLPRGLDKVGQATALPQQAHKDLTELLRADPAFPGVDNKAATIPHLLAKAMVLMVLVA